MEILRLVAICLSLWLALIMTWLNVDVWISRLTKAIRKQGVKWEMTHKTTSFYWVLFLLSCLI